MSTDTIALLLILGAAPAATAFPIWYGFTAPWWKSPVGRERLVSSTALALLIDISLIYQWLGDDYFLREAVRLSVFGGICVGCWLTFGALAYEKRKARKRRQS